MSAGFHGHGVCYASLYIAVLTFTTGMARCVVASRGLAHQLLSATNEWDPRLPQSFQITSERLNASYGSALETLWKDKGLS